MLLLYLLLVVVDCCRSFSASASVLISFLWRDWTWSNFTRHLPISTGEPELDVTAALFIAYTKCAIQCEESASGIFDSSGELGWQMTSGGSSWGMYHWTQISNSDALFAAMLLFNVFGGSVVIWRILESVLDKNGS